MDFVVEASLLVFCRFVLVFGGYGFWYSTAMGDPHPGVARQKLFWGRLQVMVGVIIVGTEVVGPSRGALTGDTRMWLVGGDPGLTTGTAGPVIDDTHS